MSIRRIVIRTDAGGDFTFEAPFEGLITGMELELQTLETPDVDVSDGVYETSLISVDAVAADTVYQPGDLDEGGATVVMGTLKVVVAGGGANKRGRLSVLY